MYVVIYFSNFTVYCFTLLFCRFIGEETVSAGGHCELTDDPTWIVDPIDGTTNFVHGY